jgi:diguanylate cyclase (GGDEF)-like protein
MKLNILLIDLKQTKNLQNKISLELNKNNISHTISTIKNFDEFILFKNNKNFNEFYNIDINIFNINSSDEYKKYIEKYNFIDDKINIVINNNYNNATLIELCNLFNIKILNTEVLNNSKLFANFIKNSHISKKVKGKKYKTIIEDLKNEIKDLELLSYTDELTKIHNRRSYFEINKVLIQQIKRHKTGISVLMIDIDKFKNINDTYGHSYGDLVLKKLAKTIQNLLRESDCFGRIGGEEFAVSLPDTSIDSGAKVANKIRKSIEDLIFFDENKNKISITISIGVSYLSCQDKNGIKNTLKQADKALFEAKNTGRNKVCVYR